MDARKEEAVAYFKCLAFEREGGALWFVIIMGVVISLVDSAFSAGNRDTGPITPNTQVWVTCKKANIDIRAIWTTDRVTDYARGANEWRLR